MSSYRLSYNRQSRSPSNRQRRHSARSRSPEERISQAPERKKQRSKHWKGYRLSRSSSYVPKNGPPAASTKGRRAPSAVVENDSSQTLDSAPQSVIAVFNERYSLLRKALPSESEQELIDMVCVEMRSTQNAASTGQPVSKAASDKHHVNNTAPAGEPVSNAASNKSLSATGEYFTIRTSINGWLRTL
ncbi:hypothetical protein ACLMJK_004798 [Lecanora helva]